MGCVRNLLNYGTRDSVPSCVAPVVISRANSIGEAVVGGLGINPLAHSTSLLVIGSKRSNATKNFIS